DIIVVVEGKLYARCRFQGKKTKEIVSKVEEFLARNSQLEVDTACAYSTELAEAERMLFDRVICSQPIGFFSKRGCGYIGTIGVVGGDKSIFVQMLFNKFKQHFDASSILLNVEKQASTTADILKIQSVLLRDLVKGANCNLPEIQNPAQGCVLLQKAMQAFKY
ncbi:hypothetical protein L7F22_045614, partial [Adiantum nelumboides]|nr:hypothetical protein [Adiantum nelumboides]